MKTIIHDLNLDSNIPANPIRMQLRRRLLALSYHAFAECLCLLLNKLGYEDVQLAGRVGWKGRNQGGGYDIEAFLPAGVGRRRVIVQAKQFDALPIFQRSVDELRGTCLRAGAHEALLITTSTFSPVVQRTPAASEVQIAPVRLIDGNELLDLLFLHRIGIWEELGEGAGTPRRLGLDYGFFDDLSKRYAGRGRNLSPSCANAPKQNGWLVTIHVSPSGNACCRPIQRKDK